MELDSIRRLRWRLRGALQWPTFVAVLVGETLLLHLLPIAGEGTGVAAALLLAAFFNLTILAGLAPLAGIAVRRRRADLPRAVARDYAASALMLLLVAVILGAGIAHRPAILAGERAFRAQSDAVRRFVRAAPLADYRRRIDQADTWRLEADLFRTCIPGRDPTRRLCLIVNTAINPPGLTVDPNRAPNSTYVGPSAVGRGRG